MKKKKPISQQKSAGKYPGRIIKQGKRESKYKYLRRISLDVILPATSGLTIGELVLELAEITGYSVTKWFLLSTLVFPESGVIIEGDTVWASSADLNTSRIIKRLAKTEIVREGGKIERRMLFARLRVASNANFSEAAVSESLFGGRSNFRWRVEKGDVMIYLS